MADQTGRLDDLTDAQQALQACRRSVHDARECLRRSQAAAARAALGLKRAADTCASYEPAAPEADSR